MKKALLLIPLLLILTACEKENRWDCFTSMGDDKTESRSLNAFTAVYLEDKIDLEYRYAPEYRAEVTFGENIVEHIKTEVRDGALHIANEARCNWVRDLSEKPKITLFAPTFDYMENMGTGDVTFTDTLYTETLTYEEWQANGEVKLLIKTAQANIYKHTGNTLLEVYGTTEQASIYNASTGKLDATGLISAYVECNNSSIQDLKVYSSGYLFGIIYLRGDIRYDGNPLQIEQVLIGSGRVKPV